jgi:hypothetical protein
MDNHMARIKGIPKEGDQVMDNEVVWMGIERIRDDPGGQLLLMRMSNENSPPG